MSLPTCWLLLILGALISSISLQAKGADEDVQSYKPLVTVPMRFRSEGRLTLTYLQNNKTTSHHFAFSESINSIELESVISIGYVSYPPTKYYTRNGYPTITIDSDGACKSISNETFYIPEFSWYMNVLLPELDLIRITTPNPHMVGPTGLLSLLISITGGTKFEKSSTPTIHRNIPCNVYSKTIRPPGKGINFRFEVLIPTSGVQFRGLKNTYFSVRAMTTFDQVNEHRVDNASVIIDYFNIDSMDGELIKFDRMRDDFNLPLASGCSEFMEQVFPEIKAQTFSLNYQQRTSANSILMAYDHAAGFLRREKYGISVSVWDLNEDLMYHIDTNITNIIDREVDFVQDHLSCSVSRVTDQNLGPAFRPYDKVGESLDVLKMIGASQVAYMGRGSVRDLPCSIYETILPEAPDLFALTGERVNNRSLAVDRDYIVQFYLLRGEDTDSKLGLAPSLSEAAFWPAQIVLYRRNKKLKSIEYVDHLDVYDFFWSLDGWNKKGNELFMASECFDDEDEQLRLELALTFDRVHHVAVKQEDRKLLPFNKYKLEFDLVNNVMELLQTSKMHLVEYELRLRPHHVDLSMIIGDRREDKNLTYFGTGTLPDPYTYLRNQVVLTQLSEEDCVLTSSLLVDVSLVIYCPSYQGEYSVLGASCSIITDQTEPTIVDDEADPQKPSCQVYRYTPSSVPPKRGTTSVNDNKSKLIEHQFDFLAQVPGGGAKGEILRGMVKNYDVRHETQLIVIGHYMFVNDQDQDQDQLDSSSSGSSSSNKLTVANQNVRSFDSYTYNSLGDCVRICNLDVNCRSYSYCSSTNNQGGTEEDKPKCFLSSLDIRGSKLQDQLMRSRVPLKEGQTINVLDERGSNYSLKFLDQCDIYERDYLNMFRQTEEVVRLQRKLVNQFRVAPTTFDCAKQSVELELDSPKHHIAMFAYCPISSTCLMDENLFAPVKEDSSRSDSSKGSENELLCRVYRKKYQTYFNVSAKVLTRQLDQQIELAFDTVEECSRACWNKFGQVCASFDYCSPKSCLINQIHMDSTEAELESRPKCLHYERDLRLDELRRKHMIGRHELLQEGKEVRTIGGFLLSCVTYFLVFCAFVYGLVLGRHVNDKMEAVTILRQSISAGSGQAASSTLHNLARGNSMGSSRSNLTLNDDDDRTSFDSMPDPFGSNAIRLSVINKNHRGGGGNSGDDHDPLDQDF